MLRPGPPLWLAPALVAVVALTACAADADTPLTGTTEAAAKPPTASKKPSPAPKPPQQLCAEIVGYWAAQELNGNSGYGDYQSRGLSDSQNNILLDVVAAAKAERRAHGRRAAQEFAAREAEKRCAAYYENGGPSSSRNGWPA